MSCKFCGGPTEIHVGTCKNKAPLEYDYCPGCRAMTRPYNDNSGFVTLSSLDRAGHLDLDGVACQYTHIADKICALKQGGKLLDYGCATGAVIRLMRTRGFEVFGYDIAPLSIEICKSHGLPGTTSLAEVSGRNYDVIWCSETIEHLEDPRQFMDFAKAHIAPGGVVYVQTQQPAFNGENYGLAYQTAHSVLMAPSFLDKEMTKRGFTVIEGGQNDLGCYWRFYRA